MNKELKKKRKKRNINHFVDPKRSSLVSDIEELIGIFSVFVLLDL